MALRGSNTSLAPWLTKLTLLGANKKLLESLKCGEITKDSLYPCLSAFRSLMESNPSPDLLRSLALSITYVLHKPRVPNSLHKKKSLRYLPPSSRPTSSKSDGQYIPSLTLGIEMLDLYCSVLCNPNDSTPLRKFAKAVTSKVCEICLSLLKSLLTLSTVASLPHVRRRA